MKRLLMGSALAVSSFLAAGSAWPAESSAARSDPKAQEHEPIFGGRMMTQEERAEYHARMRAAKTVAERRKVRKEQHDAMVARAKERGVSIPDDPTARGPGMGAAGGMGSSGMGSGDTGSGGMRPGGPMGPDGGTRPRNGTGPNPGGNR
jgi:hypothetical protein